MYQPNSAIQFCKNRVRVPSQCLDLSPLHLPNNAHNGSPYQSENRHPKVHREGWKPITSPPQGHHYVSSVSLPVRTGGSNRAVAEGKDEEGNQSQNTTKIQTPGLQVTRLQNYATSSSRREAEQESSYRQSQQPATLMQFTLLLLGRDTRHALSVLLLATAVEVRSIATRMRQTVQKQLRISIRSQHNNENAKTIDNKYRYRSWGLITNFLIKLQNL